MKKGKTLDPAVEALIRALAVEAVRRDYRKEGHGEPNPLDSEPPTRQKNRLQVVVRVPDGQGDYKKIIHHEKQSETFVKKVKQAAEDMRAGRDDELGIRKALREIDAKRRRGRER